MNYNSKNYWVYINPKYKLGFYTYKKNKKWIVKI